MARRLFSLLLLLFSATAWADKPFLWQIDGGGARPSYLFGSIHIPSPSVTNLAPPVARALHEADAVYCELAFDNATVARVAAASMGAKTPLSQALAPELYARAEAELQRAVPGFKLAALEKAEIWAVGLTLAMLEYQVRYPRVEPLDLQLYRAAQAEGKVTGGLETADEQLAAMNSFTPAEQVDMLKAALDDLEAMRRQGQSPVERLLTAYRSGSAEALDREVSRSLKTCSPELRRRFEQSLLHTRNARMAERIVAAVRAAPDKRFLFVVGAMHGLGQSNVVDLLKKAGAKVERAKE